MALHGRLEDVASARALLSYDPESGSFCWLVARNGFGGGVRPGDMAGTDKDGYVQIIAKQRCWRAHRLAWAFMTGELPATGMEIDHINGDRADNRWANLRLVNRRQNNLNMGIPRRNISGVKGVSWNAQSGKWLARLKHEGGVVHLGYHPSIEAAEEARKAGERVYHGEFARAA